jgi:hypothetical protein
MHRIDDPTATPTLPAPRAQGTPGYFTGGSPGSGGFAATVVRYEFMNALQEELVAVVLAAGLTLDKTDNTQLLEALRRLVRFKLYQDTTLYISPTGSDQNDGLTPTTALATGQAAWNKAITLDLNGFNLTLQFAHGTYTQPIACAGIVQGLGAANAIQLVGDMTSPNQVVFNMTDQTCLSAVNGAIIEAHGITFQASGTSGDLLTAGTGIVAAGPGARITYGNCNFGACQMAHILGISGGSTTNDGLPYTITGSSPSHLFCDGGQCSILQASVSLTGNPNFSGSFVYCSKLGSVYSHGVAFAGAATGARYFVDTNSCINTVGGGANYFPGSVAGTVDASTYGTYV